jgi:hypothetical protein
VFEVVGVGALFSASASIHNSLSSEAPILSKFTAFEAEDGERLLRNKRLDQEWAALLSNLERQRNAGLASAAARAAKAKGGSTAVEQQLEDVQPSKTKSDPKSSSKRKSCSKPATKTKPAPVSESELESVMASGNSVPKAEASELLSIWEGFASPA